MTFHFYYHNQYKLNILCLNICLRDLNFKSSPKLTAHNFQLYNDNDIEYVFQFYGKRARYLSFIFFFTYANINTLRNKYF